ncbi:MAG: aspartate kinase, partial [Pseudobutyrivibrio sp.]|nr:aspartate kinase [Pseudobutyrivibrio sp.]
MKKVVKFGGSSLADAGQFKKVGDIIRADENRVFVVPSAPGKRNSKDTKVTDMLIQTYEAALSGADVTENLSAIKARYDEIIEGLELKGFSLDDDFKQIASDIKEDLSLDYLASRGEYLNGKIMAKYLGFDFIDAKDVIFFNEEGQLNSYKTEKTMRKTLEEHPHAVIPGFYGCGKDGRVKTFSRGGSDVTG